jgi:hypothetical protein
MEAKAYNLNKIFLIQPATDRFELTHGSEIKKKPFSVLNIEPELFEIGI